MALGSTAAQVRWLVLRQSFILVCAGVLLGLPAALAGARLLKAMLFGLGPMEPTVVALAGLAMFAAAALAAYLPARRASRVDPMTALRQD
jgi:ABC-type antimicrobial peptide transport system permease subunit